MEYWRNRKTTTPLLHCSISPSLRLESVVFADRFPIHHIPPGLEVIGAPILVKEIVSVLPNIDTEDRLVAVHQRAVLIRRGNYFELSALVFDQPGPTTAKASHASRGKFFLEGVEAP